MEQKKRDAEVFGVLGDKDFTAYGIVEVVENVVCCFLPFLKVFSDVCDGGGTDLRMVVEIVR